MGVGWLLDRKLDAIVICKIDMYDIPVCLSRMDFEGYTGR